MQIYIIFDRKEPIMQEQWEDTYRDIISNIDDNLVDPYSLRTDSMSTIISQYMILIIAESLN